MYASLKVSQVYQGYGRQIPSSGVPLYQLPARSIYSPDVSSNLKVFSYRGVSAYFEGLARIEAPTLSDLDIQFFNQLTSTIPRLLQFMRASEMLRFSAVKIVFDWDFLDLMASPDPSWHQRSLRLRVTCTLLDWELASTVHFLDSISPILSCVDVLTLFRVAHNLFPIHEYNRAQWRRLLRSFSNVKTLCVPESLSEQYLRGGSSSDVFTSFILERRAAGHNVNLASSSNMQLQWRLQQALRRLQQAGLEQQNLPLRELNQILMEQNLLLEELELAAVTRAVYANSKSWSTRRDDWRSCSSRCMRLSEVELFLELVKTSISTSEQQLCLQ